MNVGINLGAFNGIFAVPNSVVDNNIKLAGAQQLKVLLFLLRHSGKTFSYDEISSALGIDISDIRDAVGFWTSVGIISDDHGELTPQKNTLDAVIEQSSQEEAPRPRPITRAERPSSAFVASRISSDEEIAFLMQEAEVIMARPISSGESSTLLMLHDNDGLPAPVILMILQLAFSQQKGMKYVETIGAQWSALGVTTIEQAEEQIRKIDDSKRAWRVVQNTMGLDRHSPTVREREMAERWVLDWKFSEELIREAYEACVDAKGKYHPAYVNKILEKWHVIGLDTLEKVHAERASRTSGKKDKKPSNGMSGETSYDLEAFENTSMFDD